MSHDVTIDGVLYISSKRAAELTGYTQDYIGQLARAGKVIARRVGGLWYVLQDSVAGYKETSDAYVPTPPSPVEYNTAAEEASYVTFDGKTYISASRASKMTSYHQDYIGQLARAGKVLSRQVGHRWYVDIEGLKRHKIEKDALLAAVQTESVGLNKPILEQDTGIREAASEPVEPFYTYTTEVHPLFPTLQSSVPQPVAAPALSTVVPESSAIAVRTPEENIEESTTEEAHIIPIRVVRTLPSYSPREALSTEPFQTERGGTRASHGAVYKITGALVVVFIALLAYNIQPLRPSDIAQSSVLKNTASGISGGTEGTLNRLKEGLEAFLSKELTFDRSQFFAPRR